MHALPLTYGKDMQEDKEPLFDAIDTVELCLDATAGMLDGIVFDRERLEEASGDEMLAATEVADLLVRQGVPFREAHGIVGGLVRDAIDAGRAALRAEPRGAAPPAPSTSTTPTTRCWSAAAGWSRSGSPAAPAPRPLAVQLDLARETLAAVKARVRDERDLERGAGAAERTRASARLSSTAASTTSPAS